MTWMLDLYKEIGRPTIDVVRELLEQNSMKVSAEIVGVSQATLKKYAIEKGIPWTPRRQCPEGYPRHIGKEYKNSHMIEHDGRRMSLADWSRECGVHHKTILDRFKKGWTVEAALTTPPRRNTLRV